MYSVKPRGIKLKGSDRDVEDGFLQESINLQWRDDAFRPIPKRIISQIGVAEYKKIILHKVSDENQINVLGYRAIEPIYLSADLAATLGGDTVANGNLEWFGKIVDGNYSSITPVEIEIPYTAGMSFIILNGLVYFMGDGSSTLEQYYYRLQFSDGSQSYEVKDMYLWKSLIPFYPRPYSQDVTFKKFTEQVISQCGILLYRFALVLKSGEVVLHSPIYANLLFAINRDDTAIADGDTLQNIHTIINMNFSFLSESIYDDEVSAINIYASVPYYESKVFWDTTSALPIYYMSSEKMRGELVRQSEKNFYLIKTIEKPSDEKLLLTVGSMDSDIVINGDYYQIDIDSIAAGEIMPVDNFSYHKLYGRLSTYSGRIIIEKPTTVLSGGHIRALSLVNAASDIGFRMETEDGSIDGIASQIDKSLEYSAGLKNNVNSRGLISYPDSRAGIIGASTSAGGGLHLFKSRKNNAHNMSCAYGFYHAGWGTISQGQEVVGDATMWTVSNEYDVLFVYAENTSMMTAPNQPLVQAKYSSENRVQISEVGEFSVWPAMNSYRIGEGKIMGVGNNNVNPSVAEVVAPLIVGTTDGVYTVNLDPTGNNFVSSITKSLNMPYISSEVLQIGSTLLFISDKGLIALTDGRMENLTYDFFYDQKNDKFPDPESVYPYYNLLTAHYFGESGNPYELDDVVTYLRGALLAFDGRRNNIWCSNPGYKFSLVYNLETKFWGMSNFVFSEKSELFSIINTSSDEIYNRYLVRENDVLQNNLLLLSGENMNDEVFIHMLTRPFKIQHIDSYKKLKRLFSRCQLFRGPSGDGYLVFGVWGKQDHNNKKKSIPIVIKYDGSEASFPDDVRQDIPVGRQRGKYKSLTVLQGGQVLPDSSIESIDIEALLVDNKKIR